MEHTDPDRAVAFMKLLHAFQSIERVAHAPDKVRYENDVEHSYLLAMMAWYLIDALQLDLDKSRAIEYALSHDLVEVYAGDTYIFDTEALKTKSSREEKARLQIQSEFPEFSDLHTTIARYGEQDDAEGVFVRALDKLLPVITNYLQDGKTWKEMDVQYDEIISHKTPRVAHHESVREIFEHIMKLIEEDSGRFFNTKSSEVTSPAK